MNTKSSSKPINLMPISFIWLVNVDFVWSKVIRAEAETCFPNYANANTSYHATLAFDNYKTNNESENWDIFDKQNTINMIFIYKSTFHMSLSQLASQSFKIHATLLSGPVKSPLPKK
jgi:hypothetical protein